MKGGIYGYSAAFDSRDTNRARTMGTSPLYCMVCMERYIKMKTEHLEFLKSWVRALRSGEYKQGKGVLKNHDQYCCLGVAGELYLQQKDTPTYLVLEGRALLPNHDEGLTTISDFFESCLLDRTTQDKLAGMNDGLIKTDLNSIPPKTFKGLAKTFEEIADWIEENLIRPNDNNNKKESIGVCIQC